MLVMLNVFAIAGFVLLCFEIAAAISNDRNVPPGRRERAALWIIGALLAVGSLFVEYPWDKYRICGAPFVAVIFEPIDHGWRDYIGLTLPAMIGNGVFALLLPQLPRAITRWAHRRRRRAYRRA